MSERLLTCKNCMHRLLETVGLKYSSPQKVRCPLCGMREWESSWIGPPDEQQQWGLRQQQDSPPVAASPHAVAINERKQ